MLTNKVEEKTQQFWTLSKAWRKRGNFPEGVSVMSDLVHAFTDLSHLPPSKHKHLVGQAANNLQLVIQGQRRRKKTENRRNVVSLAKQAAVSVTQKVSQTN